MTKKNIMPIVVLTVICVAVAVLLSAVNMLTAPIIKENAEKKVQASLYEVFPDADGFDKIDVSAVSGAPSTVTEAYSDRGGKGYVVVFETSTSYTSGAKLSASVGIGSDLKIVGVKLNSYSETRDFGKQTYPQKFVGLGSDDINVNDNELLVSGVTFSSKAFKAAVKDALNFVTLLSGGEVEIPVAQRVAALMPGAVEIPVPAGAPSTVKAVYSGFGGHVIYALNDDAEIVAHVSNGGEILATDIVEDSEGAGENSAAVKALAADAVAIANVRISDIAGMISSQKIVEIKLPDAPDSIKRLFVGEGGYVAETLTSTEYVERETQALVAIDGFGTVLLVDLISWTVGNDVNPGENYTDQYNGKTAENIDAVEFVTQATYTSQHLHDAIKAALTLVKGGNVI